MTPRILKVFFFSFFSSLFKFVVKEKSMSRSRLYRARIPVAHACLSCMPNSVMGNKASLLCAVECLCHALCLIETSLPLAQCSFPVATQMNSVATWDLLTMAELCRDLKFLCRDLLSTAYISLCRDTEKSCCGIRLLTTSTLCHDIEKLCRDMGFSFM